MIELVIVSRLLEYPDAALWQHQQELWARAFRKTQKKRQPGLCAFLRRCLKAPGVLEAAPGETV